MSNKKKCRNCKEYFPQETMISVPLGFLCSDKCVQDVITKDRLKRQKQAQIAHDKKKNKLLKSRNKKWAREKKDFYENDLKTRKQAAKLACNAYIRARDKGLPCICCKRPINGTVHAGHWQESGNNPKIRYHEDNIHAQSSYCNTYKGGDSGDYELNLRAKIGNDRVDWLKTQLGGTVKRTPQDYKEIELKYKKKLKESNL